jgi:hypothetical protein
MPGFTPGGLAPDATTFDPQDRLDQAESIVRDFCRWHIAPSVQQQIDVDGSDYVTQVLPTRHVTAVSAVTLDGASLTEGVHFKVDRIGILRRIDGGRWCGRLTLTMTHGYADPPPAVQAIIADLAKNAGSAGAATMVAGPYTMTTNPVVARAGAAGLSDEQMKALSRYALEPGIC